MLGLLMSIGGLSFIINDITSAGRRIENFKPGLERIVRDYVSNEVETNFLVGGRPPWAPVEEDTLKRRMREGTIGSTLIRTGLLMETAVGLESWSFDSDEAVFRLPPGVEYGYQHEYGNGAIPARPFMELPEDALDRMEEIFLAWVEGET